jgi:DNA-directed RNA polymerase specialized sigma24 family protein
MTSRRELRFQVGGTVNPRTGVYIVRPSDDRLLNLLEGGEYANVLCSRQMGKSSLLVRTAARLEDKGFATATIDVAGCLGSPTADEWYQGLLDEIAYRLRLDVNVVSWWESSSGITPNQRLIRFFSDEIASKTTKPVVIFLDEIDSTHKLPYTDDFFVAIRAIYNDRASQKLYDNITFCLAGVATPNELIKDRRTTPYNIGRTIELQDFDSERDDLSPLYEAISSNAVIAEGIVGAVLEWTGGHPYLTVRLCDQIVAQQLTLPHEVDGVIEETFESLDQLHSDVHFQQVLRFLDERAEDKLEALSVYQAVCSGKKIRDETAPAQITLRLAGLVKRDPEGFLMVRNQIYSRVFTYAWASRAKEEYVHPFDKLLARLAPDRELAGAEYERLRTSLVRFFDARRLPRAEELADQTLDRVANRLEKGEAIEDLGKYCFGVANRIVNESRRETRKWVELPDIIRAPELLEEDHRMVQCFDRCMGNLTPESRELILEYYSEKRFPKIDRLRELAASRGIPVNALRIRSHRIKVRLEACMRECLERNIEEEFE